MNDIERVIEFLKNFLKANSSLARTNGKYKIAQTTHENISLAISALEKQIAKKPKKIKLRQGTQWLCPACGDTVAGLRVDLLYCNGCGQKLDWSVE